MEKICTKCKKHQLISEFNKNATKPDGLQNICKVCSRSKSRTYYSENKVAHRAYINKVRTKQRKEYRRKLNALKLKYGCRLCKEDDPVCLDFHHLDPKTKEFTVATKFHSGLTWDRLVPEINKCVCVCSNCHRKVHAKKKVVTADMLCQEK